jgi:molecular chaperone GrpE
MTKPDKKEEEKPFSEDKSKAQKNEPKEKKDFPAKEETAEDKLKAVEEKLLRAIAETENQRRRFERERQEAFDFGGFNFARESLSLLDNIDRAINSFKNDDALKNNKDLGKIIEGIEIVKKDLVSIFKKNSIEAIECLNKKFDPNFHQAMLEIEDNTKEAGTVIQEIQKGYMMKDRLLRPSLVGVTKKREQKDKETKTNETKSEKNDEKK